VLEKTSSPNLVEAYGEFQMDQAVDSHGWWKTPQHSERGKTPTHLALGLWFQLVSGTLETFDGKWCYQRR